MSERPTLICLTPVKNEAWILDRFLTAAGLWADRVIVADQGSIDGSREIALRHPKVTLIENPSPDYDEDSRQRLLLEEARRIAGERIVIALDADEVLTANWRDSPEWEQILSAPPGTLLRFHWANILPDWERCWIPPDRIPFGFIDDASPHAGTTIHSTRVPVKPDSLVLDLDDIKVAHLQYTAWGRMKSKQRWYQCWERIHHPTKRPIQIYRQYHQMDARPASQIHEVDEAWFSPYSRQGLRFAERATEDAYWSDREVLEWLHIYGAKNFRRLDLWDTDWVALSRRLCLDVSAESVRDPRGPAERAVHRWLRRSQGQQMSRRVRWMQRLLIPFGW